MSKPAATEHLEGTEAPADQRPRNGTAAHARPVAERVDAFDVLDALTGSVDAPADWAAEHDHYLYGTPKRGKS
jgi:hypothetical protein